MIRKRDRKAKEHATDELIRETRRLKRQLEAVTIRLDTFYQQLQKEVDRLQTISDGNREDG